MNAIKIILGITFYLIGIYIGGWVMFVGGIVDVIDQIRAVELNSMAVAIGIAKVFFCGLGFGIPTMIGNMFLASVNYRW